MLAYSHGRRSLDKALGAVSPLAFADAVERYITALPAQDVHALVAHSIKHFDAAERVQFAMFLGYETRPGGQDEPLTGAGISAKELHLLIDGCDDFLPNRFAAFLRENRRAIPALGDDVLKRILASLPKAQFDESSTPGDDPKRRLPIPIAALVALTLLVAIAPLIAQYAHQRGMIDGPADVVPVRAPQPPPARVAQVVPNPLKWAAAPPLNARAASRIPRRAHEAGAKPVHGVHRTIAVQRPARHRAHRPSHRAIAWKFDRSQNPYFTRNWRRVAIAKAAPARTAAAPHAENGFEARARLAVASYLGAVIAGDTQGALRHLGMPSGTDPKAISESPIVSKDAHAQIVGVKSGDNGQTRVQVDITSRRGEYFEVFSVAPDGPAVKIADRYFIPVNRTAEEVSAKLLAKTH